MNKGRALHLGDAMTGLSLAGLLLPEAVAYSGLANLPPQAGVIGLFAGLLCYALLGRSRYAIVTATSSSAAVLAAATLALGANATVAARRVASILVCATGIAFLLAGSARLGAMSNLIARPVLRGFSFGLALVIAVKQWPHIAAMHTHSTGFFALLVEILRAADTWQPTSAGSGPMRIARFVLRSSVCAMCPGVLMVIVARHRRRAVARRPRRGADRPHPADARDALVRGPRGSPMAADGGICIGADVHPVRGVVQLHPHLRAQA